MRLSLAMVFVFLYISPSTLDGQEAQAEATRLVNHVSAAWRDKQWDLVFNMLSPGMRDQYIVFGIDSLVTDGRRDVLTKIVDPALSAEPPVRDKEKAFLLVAMYLAREYPDAWRLELSRPEIETASQNRAIVRVIRTTVTESVERGDVHVRRIRSAPYKVQAIRVDGNWVLATQQEYNASPN